MPTRVQLVATNRTEMPDVQIGRLTASSYVSVPDLPSLWPCTTLFFLHLNFLDLYVWACVFICAWVGGMDECHAGSEDNLMVRPAMRGLVLPLHGFQTLHSGFPSKCFHLQSQLIRKVIFFLKNWESKPTKRWCYSFSKEAFNLLSFL